MIFFQAFKVGVVFMNGIVLFDLDRTLFDTDKMLKLQRKELSDILDIPEDQTELIEGDYYESIKKESGYDLDQYCEFIGKRLKITDVIIKELLWNKVIFESSIYDETPEVIIALHNKGYDLGIFSEGPKNFQKRKYQALRLKEKFNKNLIFINEEKRSASYLANLPERAIIVDDSIEVIEVLKKSEKKFELYWLNRENTTVATGIRTIHSLRGLKSALK